MIPPLLHIASRLRYDTVNRHLASTHLNLNRRVWSGLLVGASLLLWEGCALEKPEQEQRIGELGRFHFRPSENRMEGVIVGAPHGSAEPAAALSALSANIQELPRCRLFTREFWTTVE